MVIWLYLGEFLGGMGAILGAILGTSELDIGMVSERAPLTQNPKGRGAQEDKWKGLWVAQGSE